MKRITSKTMENKKQTNPVPDYWKFTRELRAQVNAVQVLSRCFFSIDELCDWSITNNATYVNDNGARVGVVEGCLGERQYDAYKDLVKAVSGLKEMLEYGKRCFTVKDNV